MFNFFVEKSDRQDSRYFITGSDCNHIKNVLRMKTDEKILVSCDGVTDLCYISSIDDSCVIADIEQENYQSTDLPVKIYLYQGLPKSDKMELIIQKTVELGVHSVIPTQMHRCVVKLDDKKKKSKTARWQSISESAAKQSKRSTIPEISDVMSFTQALDSIKEMDLVIVPYESKRGMQDTKDALSKIKKGISVAVFIGPEGGFEESEVDKLIEKGAVTVSLGQRILRTETAAITATAMCMLYTEMTINGDNND